MKDRDDAIKKKMEKGIQKNEKKITIQKKRKRSHYDKKEAREK